MKILITKTSDWEFKEIREITTLKELLDLMNLPRDKNGFKDMLVLHKTPVISHKDDNIDFEVEIYDEYRE